MIVLPAAFGCLGAVFVSIPPIIAWTYAAIRVDMPLADAELATMDMALRFDWQAFIAFVDASPWLSRILGDAYSSFYFQLLFLPVLLVIFRREQRAFAMLFAYYLLCAISSVISVWYPALGAYVAYAVSGDELANINAKFGYFFLNEFYAVRSDPSFTLRLDKSAGILTFPSVHVGVAVLCAWAAWEVKWLRYPFALINIAMTASAISHGSHYFIDVIGGIGVAGLCISITAMLFYRRTGELGAATRAPRLGRPSPASA
jgi:membrane-associated phospholipid phosphatase